MRLGIAHHFGWAIAVTATADHQVVDRRRIELIEADLPPAPVHHVGGPHEMHRTDDGPISDNDLAALVAKVRASVARATAKALDGLTADLDEPIRTISLRAWPADFPTDIATQRRVPYESRADSVMYCQELAEAAHARDWSVHLYDAKTIEAEVARRLGDKAADDVLHGPRKALGPPWSKDHRVALAATVVAS